MVSVSGCEADGGSVGGNLDMMIDFMGGDSVANASAEEGGVNIQLIICSTDKNLNI